MQWLPLTINEQVPVYVTDSKGSVTVIHTVGARNGHIQE